MWKVAQISMQIPTETGSLLGANQHLALQDIEEIRTELIPSLTAQRTLRDFAEQHTVDNLESLFRVAGHRLDVRRSVIALGVLLRPMLTQLRPSISKSVVLPLPLEPPLAAILASIWLELLMPFFSRAELEIGLLMTKSPIRPILSVSFSGAHPQALETVWRPDSASEHMIDIRDADWVDEVLSQDASLAKLASYLQSPSLSLARAIRTFRETFIGV
jgi:type VI secretion system protein ImpM